jgi:hypothetical protein
MEDKPGEDGSKGIIVVDSMPGVDSGAQGIIDDNMPQGIIVVDSMPGVDSGAQGIIIVHGMPSGFEMGEGMTAMMGEGGFGPGPYLVGKLELAKFGFPAELGPGEESCIQVALSPNQSEPLEGPDPYYPADSYFDVFFELDTTEPQSENTATTAVKVVQVQVPSILQCTPIPGYTPPTATRPPASPTPPPATNTPIPKDGQIKVHLYMDANSNGNQDRGEVDYPNVKVSLANCSCRSSCTTMLNATTNKDGNVLFSNLHYGPYCVTTVSRLTPTTTYPVNVNVNSPSLITKYIGYK